jgi:hypothetical protein
MQQTPQALEAHHEYRPLPKIPDQLAPDDPALLQQGKTDVTLCHADLDAGPANGSARACMAERGYALVQKAQAEEVRAAYATAVQRKPKPPDDAAR